MRDIFKYEKRKDYPQHECCGINRFGSALYLEYPDAFIDCQYDFTSATLPHLTHLTTMEQIKIKDMLYRKRIDVVGHIDNIVYILN
jgi:hypothetical protein